MIYDTPITILKLPDNVGTPLQGKPEKVFSAYCGEKEVYHGRFWESVQAGSRIDTLVELPLHRDVTANRFAQYKGHLIMLVICGNIPVLNIQWPNIILPLVLAWYILTELGSILENAIKLGANPPAWLTKILKNSLTIVESVGDAAADKAETADTAEQVAAVVKDIMAQNAE